MRKYIEIIVRKSLSFISEQAVSKYSAILTQFIQFGIVGVSNTLVSYVLNVLVLLALKNAHVSWDYIAGNIVAFILSVLWSFYWNNKYVFKNNGEKERVWWKVLLKTYLCYAITGILLNNILSWLWITRFGMSKYLAPFVNLVISVPLNFFMNKLWAYQK
ncbi:MAG: GtrA family protein [Acidaminococcaceae bacterium]|nr:GtrA family protein [Acidaminococcaceae bacterium]